MITDFSE
jgi:hypothetical protein